MPRRESKAALDLSAALEREEASLSPRQQERRRHVGLLGRARQRGRGQPEGGSTVDYGADVRERALDAFRLHNEWRNAHLAVLAMFGEGRFRVEKLELEGAFARSSSGLHHRLLGRSRDMQPIDIALEVASGRAERASRAPNHKEIRARLKRTRRSPSDSLRRLLFDLYFEAVMILLTGRPASEDGLNEVMTAVGVDAMTRERLPGQDPPLDVLPTGEITTAVEGLGLERMGKIVTAAALEWLELARDDLRALVDFSREFSTYVQRVFGFPDAFGFAAAAAVSALSVALAAPAVALLRARDSEGLQEVRALFEEATPRFAAMNALLDAVPADYHAWFRGPRFGRSDLSFSARADLARRLGLFAREHPNEFSLVATWEALLPANR